MDDSRQRTEALKKAFADVILNLTKETAARVIASEKKAARFQQELATCKDEALQTLLRVKCIMDNKINEKDRISFDQARRIQELETQLEEAKETIKSLEVDLERVNKDMEILKSNKAQTMQKEDSPSHKHIQLKSSDDHDKSMQLAKPVLCSPSYESESVLYKKLPTSPYHQTMSRKSLFLNPDKSELDIVRAVNPNSPDPMVSTNGNCSKGEIELRGLSTGRRAKRRSMRKARLLTSIKGYVKLESCKIPSDPDGSSLNILEVANPSLGDLESERETGLQFCLLDKSLSSVVDADCPGVGSENKGLKDRACPADCPEVSSENTVLKDTACPSGSLPQDSTRDTIFSRVSFSKSDDHRSSSDGKPVSSQAKTNGVGGTTGDLKRQQEELPLVDSDDKKAYDRKSAEGGTSQGTGDGFLKYTFRRKRIRGSSNDAPDTTDPEKSNSSKKKPCSNEDFAPEPPKPLAGRQSSSDSRRIAQVARQLISLSQKRWG